MSQSIEDVYGLYNIERTIFCRLIASLVRDPGQSLVIMALWMCLDDIYFSSITRKIGSLPDGMLNHLAEEAVGCLRYLESDTPPPMFSHGGLPLTNVLMERTVSLNLFSRRKITVIYAIKSFLNKVCAYIFSDILAGIYPSDGKKNGPLIIPGFPHPIFGRLRVVPRPLNYVFCGNLSWSFHVKAPAVDRTLFLTFCGGYPAVTKKEVIESFTSQFGDCVEYLFLETSSNVHNQCLYGRLVVRDIQIMDDILSDGSIAKLKINGKDVWARKFQRQP